ncbi:DUF3052 domain-containing protein [Naumannella halotolerans]|uniref:DUF3052 family protein n=1 Tax=Naumannella halotolerans TaxID=993414 RepID=A0A4R7JB29_9ACTN|nr:Protein of unknown function (DUF3052) [Naumannella halotolerans]
MGTSQKSAGQPSGGNGSKAPGPAQDLRPGLTVQELGWDTDVDDALRVQIEDAIDAGMIEEAEDAVDVVVLWWREEDGDVGDGLMDALTDLADDGRIWLLTPKVGRDGYVDPADISEAALTAGLAMTNTVGVSPEWSGSKLVRTKGDRR